VVASELSRALARLQRRVVVLTSDVAQGMACTAGTEREPSGVVVRRHRARIVAHTPVMPGLFWSLLRLPRQTVVHVHVAHAFVGEVARVASTLRRKPYVVHFHLNIDPSGPMGVLLPAYKRWLMAPTLRGAAAVIALSPGMANELVTRFGVSPDRVHVVGNAVARDFITAGRERPVERLQRPLRLLFAGRLAPQKNVGRLLRAVELVSSPVQLRIAGDGEQRHELELRAAASRHEVSFLGHVDATGLREQMAWADVLVMTSEREGMPLVAMEALAMGLPVLSTDVPGSDELLRGVGLLVAPDEEAVALGIQRLMGDEELRAALSAAGRAASLQRDWPEVARRVWQVYVAAGLVPPTAGD
jgi:glycosyltransferase involved in cell wall biosynthesis